MMLEDLMDLVKGKKTYFMSVLMVLTVAAYYLGWLSMEALQAVLGVELAAALAALRAGVSKGK